MLLGGKGKLITLGCVFGYKLKTKQTNILGIPEFLLPLLSFMVTVFLSRAHFAEQSGHTFKPGDYFGKFYKYKHFYYFTTKKNYIFSPPTNKRNYYFYYLAEVVEFFASHYAKTLWTR